MSSVQLGQSPSGDIPLQGSGLLPGPVRAVQQLVNSLAPEMIRALPPPTSSGLDQYKVSLLQAVERLFAQGKIREPGIDLIHAAKIGNVEAVRASLLFAHLPQDAIEEAILCAAKGKHLQVLDLLMCKEFSPCDPAIISATLRGDLDTEEFFARGGVRYQSDKSRLYESIIDCARLGGQQDLLERLLDRRTEFGSERFLELKLPFAALSGNLNVVEYALSREKISQEVLKKTLWIAALSGNLKIVECILAREEMAGQGFEQVLECANKGEQLEAVRLLLARGDISTKGFIDPVLVAANNGHAEIVQLLLDTVQTSPECLRKAARNAAAQGFPRIVELLLSTGKMTQDINLVDAVAQGELMSVLLLCLSEGGIDRDHRGSAVVHAATNGDLECLQLLLNTGDIDRNHHGFAVEEAARYGHLECLRLLLSTRDIDSNHRGNAVSKVVGNGHLECLQLLLNTGDIDRNRRGFAVEEAARYGHLECLRLLLSTRDIDSNHRGSAVKAALLNRQLGVVRFLLRNDAGDFIDIPPHVRDEIVMALSSRGFLEELELFLQNTPPRSISTSARDSAITQATGPQRNAIRDVLGMIETYDDRVAARSVARVAAAGTLYLPSWEDLREKPLDYLRQATEIKFRRVSFGDDKARDLGGVSKQFITILIDSLIAKGDLEIDPIFRLPVQTNEKQKQTLELLGKFLSHIHQRNEERNDKLLIGPRFAREFFVLLREGLTEEAKIECFKAIIHERNDPHTEFFVRLMDNSEDEIALTEYKETYGYETIEEAKAEFLARKNSIFSALDLIKRHLEGALKEDVKRNPWDLSLQLQGQLVSKEALLSAFKIESPGSDPVFTGMVEWLKEWIGQADEEALKTFVKAITGRDSMAGNLKIGIKPSWREDKAFEIHSCCNSLDLPKLAALPPKDDFLAALVNVIQGEGYNIA